MKISKKLERIRRERIAKRHYQPFVSVIVLTYNQTKLLRLSLKALFRQGYPKDKYEIIIADDGSSDGAKDLVRMMKESPILLKYCSQEDKGFRAAKARNIGAKHAKGEVLIFLDADVIADTDLITQHVKSQSKYDVVCGYAAGHKSEKQVNLKSITSLLDRNISSLRGFFDLGEGREPVFSPIPYSNSVNNDYLWEHFQSNNFSIKRGSFMVFRFDERFIGWGEEDIEFAYRLFKAGKSFFFNKKCYSIHYEEKMPGMLLNYTPKKINSQINNMSLFYRIHTNDDVRNYIIRRFVQLPDQLLTKNYDISKTINVDKTKNKRLLQAEFRKGKATLASYPSRIYVELTKNCNMHCKMCVRELRQLKNSEENNMKFELFKRIAYEFFPYADFVDLRGVGESLLYPRMTDVLKLCSKFDCDFGLLTNLSVKNYRLLESMIRNNFWVGISIDGPNKEIYEKIRGKGYFNQVLRNIRFIVRKSRQHNYDLDNKLYFLVTVQKDNFSSLPSFVELAKKLGVKKIEMNPVVSSDPNINLSTVREETRKKIEEAIVVAKRKKIDLIVSGLFFEKEFTEQLVKKYDLQCPPSYSYILQEGYKFHKKCSKGYSHLFIANDGKIGPCNHLTDMLVLGDITTAGIYTPFLNQWNNDGFVAFRKKINSKERPRSCLNCVERQYPLNYS